MRLIALRRFASARRQWALSLRLGPCRLAEATLRVSPHRQTRKGAFAPHEKTRKVGCSFPSHARFSAEYADWLMSSYCPVRSVRVISCSPKGHFVSGWRNIPKGECADLHWRCRKASSQKANRRIQIALAIVATPRFRGRASAHKAR